MTTLPNRSETALVVVDAQRGVIDGAYRRDQVVANIATLVERARAVEASVIWIQHRGEGLEVDTERWRYVPELLRETQEPVVHKQHGDAFEGTELEAVLADRSVADAHTAGDKTEWGAPPVDRVIAHTNLYWRFQSGPGKHARVLPTAEVSFQR